MTRSALTAAKPTKLASATLAVAFMLAASVSAFANDSKSSDQLLKKRHKDKATIVIIDRNDRNKKRFVTEDKRKPSAATTFLRRDDEIRIRIPSHFNHHRRGRFTGKPGYGNNGHERRWAGENATIYKSRWYNGTGYSEPGKKRGPKIISVDRNTDACKGSGVCVIRP